MSKRLILILTAIILLITGCNSTYTPADKKTDSQSDETAKTDTGTATDTKTDSETDTSEQTDATPLSSGTKKTVTGLSTSGVTVKPAEVSGGAWELTLVNYEYALPENFTVSTGEITGGIKVDARIVGAYNKMFEAAKADGVTLRPSSGYRTISYQSGLFGRRVREYMSAGYSRKDAESIVETYTARPGRSEHNLGLAIDFYDSSTALTSAFENTSQGKWLRANSYKYGFIMRYASSKTAITAITYEPWHYRYVGTDAAKKIFESGQCLEEYLGKAGHIGTVEVTTTKAPSVTTTAMTAVRTTKTQTTAPAPATTPAPTTATTTATTTTTTVKTTATATTTSSKTTTTTKKPTSTTTTKKTTATTTTAKKSTTTTAKPTSTKTTVPTKPSPAK